MFADCTAEDMADPVAVEHTEVCIPLAQTRSTSRMPIANVIAVKGEIYNILADTSTLSTIPYPPLFRSFRLNLRA